MFNVLMRCVNGQFTGPWRNNIVHRNEVRIHPSQLFAVCTRG